MLSLGSAFLRACPSPEQRTQGGGDPEVSESQDFQKSGEARAGGQSALGRMQPWRESGVP